MAAATKAEMVFERRAYARVGLLGNPSDMYSGKALSFTITDFSATVRLRPSPELLIQPHPHHDLVAFPSLPHLEDYHCCLKIGVPKHVEVSRLQNEGYYGGVRLLMAICKVFYNHCIQNNISLKAENFTLSYDTNIPRQAGLSGSSAIVCAALNCLLDFYDVRHLIQVELRPNLILDAEKELGIVAGLQDRVAQVYGGLVYMDFSQEHMDKLGHGIYRPLDVNLLPPLYLIYAENPSDSGKVHSSVRQRWLNGDEFIISCMKEVAQLALDGRRALLQKDYTELARLMNRNFDLRREMSGDDVLGSVNIKMVEVARSVGASSKFTGSGGAVVALCPDGEAQAELLHKACQESGFVVQQIKVAPSVLSDEELTSLPTC
ncbi:glucuronokinase 1-like isoform X4 [Panicum virgatum]|uniref:glucuronokinase 1-like isoform X4 n=1 Tax=Panicum virgatum TaxID=38727 RepID=UPI0019D63139|nr:glucuronokinase 1-like isoform X4 [Panicum virgatum]